MSSSIPAVFAPSPLSHIFSPTECPRGEKALSDYLGRDRSRWQAFDSVEFIKFCATVPPLKVDQGSSDNFLAEQLKTELLIEACKQADVAADIEYREGYDHSYFFIASFIGEHLAFHCANVA